MSAFGSFLFALPYYALLLIVLYLLGLEGFAFGKAFLGYVALRAITDAVAEWSKMESLRHGEISFIVCFLSLSPAMVLVTSPILTGDIPSPMGIGGVLLTVVGTLIAVYRPGLSFSSLPVKGILLALMSAFFFSLNSCFDKLAVQEASPVFSGCAMTVAAALLLSPFAFRQEKLFKSYTSYWRAFTLRGAFELGHMVLKLWALQYLQAPYVVGLMKASLLFSILGGKVIFRDEDFLQRFLAGTCITLGIIFIGFAAL